MLNPAREWTAFVGGSLALMGVSLIAAAARRARDAMVWENERRRLAGLEALACEDSSFERLQLKINRASGAAVLLAGAAALASVATGRAWGRGPAGAVGLGFGAFLVLAGLAGALARALGRGDGPRFLRNEAGPALPLGERAAAACSWSLRALWIAYGFRLLTTLRL